LYGFQETAFFSYNFFQRICTERSRLAKGGQSVADNDSDKKQLWLVPILVAVVGAISTVAVAWLNKPQSQPPTPLITSSISSATTQAPQPESLSTPGSKHSLSNSVPYPASVVQNFMNACTNNKGSQSYCSCAIDKIQNRYSLEEYSQLEVKMVLNKTLPDEILNFMGNCRLSG